MSYQKKSDTFLSSDGETAIAYYVYTPEDTPRAVLQISHGMCEFIERYEDFAAFLCEHGIVVCGNDHKGHGASAASAEDYGYFGDKGIQVLTNDLDELRKIMRKRYRSLPFILMGHSMGSFISRDYMARYGNNVDGVILSGTAGKHKQIGLAIALSGMIRFFRGKRYRSSLIEKLASGKYNVRFAEEKDKYSWLTKDQAIRDIYRKDERCTFTFTVEAYHDMFELLKDINTDAWAQSVPKGLPVFLIAGEEDPVGAYGEGVKEVYSLLETIELNELKMKLYPGCRHELVNETERETVYQDIVEWIDGICEGVIKCRTQNNANWNFGN